MTTSLVWLVTGCSSGFGSSFCRALLERGDKVIATARNPESLEALREEGATCRQLDVTAPQEALNAKVKEMLSVHGKIDVLINNAGYAQLGSVEESR